MGAPRILLLSTYPSENPRHGGQRRVHAIANSYRKAGWEVKQIGVFPRESYVCKRWGTNHIKLPKEFCSRLSIDGFRMDLHAHRYFLDNPNKWNSLLLSVNRFSPDVIQFEQPWLFPAILPYLSERKEKILTVYSSQNVEADLMKDLLLIEGHRRADEFAKETEQLEDSVISMADTTICVTEADAKVFRARGATNVFVAPNGADRRPLTHSCRCESTIRGKRYAFVTGSAHSPNCDGFLHFLGTKFAFVPPDCRIVVAGGMATLLASSPTFKKDFEMARRRLHLFPDPTENDLNYLINHADMVLLPIAHGGGSNIKTAEALLTDRPIIGTSTAFRGYDEFRTSTGVTIKDDVGEFRGAVRLALSVAAPCSFKRENAEPLLWDRCVATIPAVMRSCIAENLHCRSKSNVRQHTNPS